MGATIKAREIAACLVLVLVAGACSSGENSLESLDETNPAATDSSTDLDSQLQIPDPLELIIDEDPDSPIAASVIFEEGDHPVGEARLWDRSRQRTFHRRLRWSI